MMHRAQVIAASIALMALPPSVVMQPAPQAGIPAGFGGALTLDVSTYHPEPPPSKLTPQQVALLLADKAAGRWAYWKARAEKRFIDFVQLMWPILEPGRPFLRGWAMEAICDHLQAVSEGRIRKLLINVPPGFCKSLLTDVFWPAWEWGPLNRPHLRYVCASYSSGLTERDNDRCRILMQHPAYRKLWGDRFEFDKDATIKFTNNKRGFKLATSVGGISTGERGDRVIIDDPHSVKQAESDAVRNEALRWFSETMPTRHNNKKKGVTIVIMQRVHQEDVSGLILGEVSSSAYANLAEGGGAGKPLPGYVHLCLPMEYAKEHPHAGDNAMLSPIGFVDPRTEEGELLFPELFDGDDVEELKGELRSWGGTYAEAGQLEQRPTSRQGGLFNTTKLQFCEMHAVPEGGVDVTVRAWDFAGSKRQTSPWTVAAKMRFVAGCVYVMDVKRERVTPTGLDELVVATAKEDGTEVRIDMPQDPGQAGLAQVAHLSKKLHGYDVRFSVEPGEKEKRAYPFAAQVGAGNVWIVRGSWNSEYLNEMRMFPASKFKDQIDASSRAYGALITAVETFVASGAEVYLPEEAPALPGEHVTVYVPPSRRENAASPDDAYGEAY